MKDMKYSNNVQYNAMVRAMKEGHRRRMVEVRYCVLVSGCIVAMVWLMVYVCFI